MIASNPHYAVKAIEYQLITEGGGDYWNKGLRKTDANAQPPSDIAARGQLYCV